jgi:carboxyl-terminal processing protease
MLLADAVKKMKGPPETGVNLRIRRADVKEGEEEVVTLEVTRSVVQTRSVVGASLHEDGHWDYFLPDHPRIGYVRITTFGEMSVDELRAVLPFEDHPIDALILDLRGNVGGLLPAAVETCDLFIDEGVIVKTRSRHGWEEEYFASPDDTVFDRRKPIVVLVDRYSASASEIVAACLQDHQRATVVGERTWGKGTVQNVIPLEQGNSALKLTTASYWRPSNRNIHRGRTATEEDDWGVRPNPDMELKLTDEQSRQLYQQLRDVNILPSPATTAAADTEVPVGEPPVDDTQLRKAVDYLESTLSPASS